MSKLDEFFKFKIGDVVRPIIQRPGYHADGRKVSPQFMQICERHLQECYGGIQAFYDCRVHTITTDNGFLDTTYAFHLPYIKLSEPELVAYDLPELSETNPRDKKKFD